MKPDTCQAVTLQICRQSIDREKNIYIHGKLQVCMYECMFWERQDTATEGLCVFVYPSFKKGFSLQQSIYLWKSCWMEKMANECNNNLTEKME